MSDFGDFEPDDAYADDGAPDALQLAIRLHEIRSALLELAGNDELPPWWEYDRRADEEAAANDVVGFLVLDVDRSDLARRIHEARRARADRNLDAWDALSPDAKELAIDIARMVYDWLTRQGALR